MVKDESKIWEKLCGKFIGEEKLTIEGFKSQIPFKIYDGFAYCPNYRGNEYCMKFPKIEFVNKSSEMQDEIRRYMKMGENDDITIYEIMQTFNEMARDGVRIEFDKKTKHYKEKCMWK